MKEIPSQPEVAKKEVSAESILTEFDLKETKEVPVDKVQDIVLRHEKEITDGLARNFYHEIKSTLYQGRMQSIRTPFYTIRQAPKHTWSYGHPGYLDVMWFLQTKAETLDQRQSQMDDVKLSFRYTADEKRITKDPTFLGGGRMFTGYDAFKLQKISLGNVPMNVEKSNEAKLEAYPDIHNDTPAPGNISPQNLKALLEATLRPAEVFSEANAKIDEIWGRHSFPFKDAHALKQAIWEFGNHDFCERDGFKMIGNCLVVPNQFRSFVRHRFGIELQECELTGTYAQRDRMTREERKIEREEMHEGLGHEAVHFASIYKQTVVIDWTSRQFGAKSVPEIRDTEVDPTLKERVKIL